MWGVVFGPCIIMQFLLSFLVLQFILLRKRELVASLKINSLPDVLWLVSVLWLFLTVPWVGLQCVIVVFPGDTHLQQT